MHHVLFVGTFGVLNFHKALTWGPVVNLLLFFMTGLPGTTAKEALLFGLDQLPYCWLGALDYAMLAMYHQ